MAGNTESIDTLVDPSAGVQVQALQTLLQGLDQQFIDLAKSATATNTVLSNSTGIADFNKKATAAAVASERLQQAQNKTAITAVQLEKAQKSLELQTARQQAAQERAAAAAQKALSPYQQLSKELDRLRAKAKDVGVEFGINSEQFKKAAEPVQILDNRLKNIDQTLGQSQRNVGNYANGFARALQDLIPFGNEIGRVINSTTELGKTTQESTSALGVLGSGFASFSTLLFVAGIAAAGYALSQFRSGAATVQQGLGILKEQFSEIGGLLTGKISLKEFSLGDAAKRGIVIASMKEQIKYQSEVTETQNAAAKAEADNLRVLAGDRNTDITQKTKYLKDAQKIEEEILDRQKDDADLQIKLALDVAQRFGKLNPVTRRRLETGGGDISEANYLANSGAIPAEAFELYKEGLNKRAAYKSNVNNQITQLQVDADNMQLRADRALAAAQDKLDKARLQGELDKAKAILANDNTTYEHKLQANEAFLSASLKLAKIQEREEIRNSDVGGRGGRDARTAVVNRLAAEQEYRNNKNKIILEAEKQESELDKAETERQRKNLADLLAANKGVEESTIALLKQSSEQQTQVIQDARDKQADIIEKQFAKGKLSQKEYNDALLLLDDQYNVDRLGQEVFLQQQILEVKQAQEDADVELAKNRGASPDAIQKIKNTSGVKEQTEAVNKAGITFGNAVNKQNRDQTKTGKDDAIEKAQELAQAVGYAQQLEGDASKLLQANYDNEIRLLQQKSELIRENADESIRAVNTSIQSEVDKQRKINLINAETAQAQKAIQQQENAAKERIAKYDRALSIANIIENTAVGVSKALAQGGGLFGIPLAAVVGALGAAELAITLATPLPKYKTGTKSAPGGLGIWGEAGIELAREPSGKTYFSPDGASIGNFPTGTEIIPNNELAKMISPSKLNYVGGQQVPWDKILHLMGNNKAQPQKRPVVAGWLTEQAKADNWAAYSKSVFR